VRESVQLLAVSSYFFFLIIMYVPYQDLNDNI